MVNDILWLFKEICFNNDKLSTLATRLKMIRFRSKGVGRKISGGRKEKTEK